MTRAEFVATGPEFFMANVNRECTCDVFLDTPTRKGVGYITNEKILIIVTYGHSWEEVFENLSEKLSERGYSSKNGTVIDVEFASDPRLKA